LNKQSTPNYLTRPAQTSASSADDDQLDFGGLLAGRSAGFLPLRMRPLGYADKRILSGTIPLLRSRRHRVDGRLYPHRTRHTVADGPMRATLRLL